MVLIGAKKKKTKIENKEVQLHKQMSLHVNAFLLLAVTSISVSSEKISITFEMLNNKQGFSHYYTKLYCSLFKCNYFPLFSISFSNISPKQGWRFFFFYLLFITYIPGNLLADQFRYYDLFLENAP